MGIVYIKFMPTENDLDTAGLKDLQTNGAQKLARILKDQKGKNALRDQIDALEDALIKASYSHRDPTNAVNSTQEDGGWVLENIQTTYPMLYAVLIGLNYILDTKIDQELLNTITKLVEDLEEVLVTSSVNSVDNVEMVEWLQRHVSNTAILNLETNPTEVTAGVKLCYKGWYKDLSLDRVIKEVVYA